MEQCHYYEFEGLTLDIPLLLDEVSGQYLEEYPDFVANPVHTPAGHPVMFAGEDACALAEEATPGGCPDCGSCLHYRPAGEHTWFGICRHPRNRRLSQKQ